MLQNTVYSVRRDGFKRLIVILLFLVSQRAQADHTLDDLRQSEPH